jgi:hypothetical protein
LSDRDYVSDRKQRDQVFAMMIGGHDAAATFASWAIEQLVCTPHALAARPRRRFCSSSDSAAGHYLQRTYSAGTAVTSVISSEPGGRTQDSFRPERFLRSARPLRCKYTSAGGEHCFGDRSAIFALIDMLPLR